jgi:nicotinate-nucleotide pyrophosphorylase (carboxylating)
MATTTLAKSYPLLLPAHLLSPLIAAWLVEDNPAFDYSGAIVGTAPIRAYLLCKAPGILCGAPFVDEIFRQLHCEVSWAFSDGVELTPAVMNLNGSQLRGVQVATVTGPVNALLLGERLALNILARLSGIATRTHALVSQVRAKNSHVLVAATRKTTPGFRLAEKYALSVGGADPHRYDLSSMVMLKDNHIWHCADIGATVAKAKALAGFSLKVDVECQSVAEAKEASAAGADIVMLDNFAPGVELAKAAAEVKEYAKGRGQAVLVEISGGVTASNLDGYLAEGVDIISTSSIHQGTPHVDFSLKIEH